MSNQSVPSNQTEIDGYRVALKFSLWAWALYWFGGGALLFLFGGLNPISILVLIGSLVTFVLLLSSGALQTTSSRNMKQFLLERPLYLILVVVVFALLAPLVLVVLDVFLIGGAAVYLAASIYAMVKLRGVYAAQDQPLLKSGLDQAFIATGLGLFAAFVIFVDSWAVAANGGTISGPATIVAVINWMSLLYPPLIMLGSRGLREPLHKPRIRAPEADANPEPTQA